MKSHNQCSALIVCLQSSRVKVATRMIAAILRAHTGIHTRTHSERLGDCRGLGGLRAATCRAVVGSGSAERAGRGSCGEKSDTPHLPRTRPKAYTQQCTTRKYKCALALREANQYETRDQDRPKISQLRTPTDKAHTNALSPTCRRGQPRVCSQDRRKIDKTDIRYQNYAHTTTHTQTRFEQRANTGRPEFAARVCCCPWLGRVRSHRDSRVCLALYRIFRNHLSVMSTCLTVFCRDHDNLSCPCSFRVRMPFVTTRLPAVTRSLTSFYLT